MSKGAFGKVRDRRGNVFDADKNTVNGIPPIEIGDVFFYRSTGQPGCQLQKVKVSQLINRVAMLTLLNAEDQPVSWLWADLKRIEVVQMSGLDRAKVKDHFETLLLRNTHADSTLLENSEDIEPSLSMFPQYAEEIALAHRVYFLDEDGFMWLMIERGDDKPFEGVILSDLTEEEVLAIPNAGEPTLKPAPFPPAVDKPEEKKS